MQDPQEDISNKDDPSKLLLDALLVDLRCNWEGICEFKKHIAHALVVFYIPLLIITGYAMMKHGRSSDIDFAFTATPFLLFILVGYIAYLIFMQRGLEVHRCYLEENLERIIGTCSVTTYQRFLVPNYYSKFNWLALSASIARFVKYIFLRMLHTFYNREIKLVPFSHYRAKLRSKISNLAYFAFPFIAIIVLSTAIILPSFLYGRGWLETTFGPNGPAACIFIGSFIGFLEYATIFAVGLRSPRALLDKYRRCYLVDNKNVPIENATGTNLSNGQPGSADH